MYSSAIDGSTPQPDLVTLIAAQYGTEGKYIEIGMTSEEVRFAITRRQEALQEIPDIKKFRPSRLLLMKKIAELSVALGKLEDREEVIIKAAEKRKKEASRKAAARTAPTKKPAKRVRKKAKPQSTPDPQEQSNLDEVPR